MARIQILELPEGTGDDRPPFVLVVDEYTPARYVLGPDAPVPTPLPLLEGVAEKIGARAVLVFEDTIDIPANEVPLDEDGKPLFLKVHIEGEFERFREQVQDEIRKAQAALGNERLQRPA
ncbi:hypothetical protein AB0D49_08240 [Streptomyces sp. NPDC048290]|uniref:hypothetical protein n=1 Tax=Streptomyces sp. NPDC048290 TaxID=3155811 RepID=UPI00341614DA